MKDFISFLVDYKEILLSSLGVILTLVCILVKRKPKTVDEFLMLVNEVCLSLPSLINKVECSGNGLSKKKEVRNSAIALLRKKLGREMSDTELDFCFKTIDTTIEDILSTPQKKKGE